MTANAPDPRIDDYLRRLRWALSPLPAEDREEIVREIHSHLLDRSGPGATAPVPFESVERELGPPEGLARRYLEGYEISLALGSGSAWGMLRTALRLLGRGAAAVGLFFIVLLYITALSFLVTALMKPLFPENVGLWIGGQPPVFLFGFFDDTTRPGVREVLGYWSIPVAIGAAIGLYAAATALLRRLLRSLRGEGPQIESGS